ncbi:hypothetical protein Cob_v005354 [Colletotrichum orbiculare MAFF 240422]|uniref:Uncharacterized protein n=1 Tax=Colletotrichum orbiculare (strain 104-T / ATCC 96160 / CBS 514.97 / LARS 414 / MAFF 240422) TaxID=1213857 RepID=N4VCI3_COLOR|nr:hypothetical protein Cob_v005354 [Colletotrichum orbiculare MAFF 240422]
MKFSLVTVITLVGAATAASVDRTLFKRQCIANGGQCGTSISETTKPCCGGLICRNQNAPNLNLCQPPRSS